MTSITALTAPTAAALTGAAPPATKRTDPLGQLDREAFLQLLVAQLKYQDPTRPADAGALISQTSQLAVVDKLDGIAASLDAAALSSRAGLAASLIGRSVTFAGPDGRAVSALVTTVRLDGPSTVVVAGSSEVPLDALLAVGTAPPPPTTVAPIAPPTSTPANDTTTQGDPS